MRVTMQMGTRWKAEPWLFSSQLSDFASSEMASLSPRMSALTGCLTFRSLQSNWITKQRKCPIREHIRAKLQWFWVYCLDPGSLVYSHSNTSSVSAGQLLKLPWFLFLSSQAVLIALTFWAVVLRMNLGKVTSTQCMPNKGAILRISRLTRARREICSTRHSKEKVSWTVSAHFILLRKDGGFPEEEWQTVTVHGRYPPLFIGLSGVREGVVPPQVQAGHH